MNFHDSIIQYTWFFFWQTKISISSNGIFTHKYTTVTHNNATSVVQPYAQTPTIKLTNEVQPKNNYK